MKILLREKQVRIKAPVDFATVYNNTYTFIFRPEYLTIKTDRKTYVDNDIFYNLISYLETDNDYKKHIHTKSYLEMIQVVNAEQQDAITTHFNPVKSKNYKSSTISSICYKYIDYKLNKNAETFEELFDRTIDENENDIENSCYVNLLVNTYNVSIQQRFRLDGRQGEANKKKLLTAEKICQICGITYKESNIGLSIKKSIKFFETYQLGLKAIDHFGNIIDGGSYEPENFNKNLFPRTLYIIVHNNHVEKLNCNETTFPKVIHEFKKQHEKLQASSVFPVFRSDKAEFKTIFIIGLRLPN